MATARTVAEPYSHISKDPRICGGKACIEGTRIRVMDIVGLHRRGFKPEKMLEAFGSSLTLAQVHAALGYYYDHPEEIQGSLREDERVAKKIDRDRAEHLKRRSSR